ncbi:MAG: SDR family NAD(P)-dependent oxidoreductase [Magnetococcales bacterium]|nr:SDR family NAD(P)-dependent oxidoreductase [Magnetococcales bacterium]
MTAARWFTHEDQLAFAALSGDANPLHMDPVVARRSHVGSQVVHGVHLLLWGLEQLPIGDGERMALDAMRVRFVKPVELGRTVRFDGPELTGTRIRWQLLGAGDLPVLLAEIGWHPVAGDGVSSLPDLSPVTAPGISIDRDLEACVGWGAQLPLSLDVEAARSLFPGLMSWLPAWQFALLLSTTRVVGMECPGLYSLYAELQLENLPAFPPPDGFRIHCQSVREAISLVTLVLEGGGLNGRIRAFRRKPPVAQADYAALVATQSWHRFSGRRVLLVGGSRGLGEVAAKLLAAGGAQVCLTWRLGQEDAARVAEDIRRGGGDAVTMQLDVTDPHSLSSLPVRVPWRPDALAYFATPVIARADKRRPMDGDELARLNACYVEAFINLVTLLREAASGPLSILYPSSVYVAEPPPDLWEYSIAKAAGEQACVLLRGLGVTIHAPRLPLLVTDQSVGILPSQGQQTEQVLLEALTTALS